MDGKALKSRKFLVKKAGLCGENSFIFTAQPEFFGFP